MEKTGVPSGLTAEEAKFVYNVEILGMPAQLAANQSGMPIRRAVSPHIVQARQILKDELRRTTGITKEDCAYGMREAIDRARLLSEPMTEIVGWEKLAKLMGYDAPQQVNINMQASVEVVRGQLSQIPEAELVKLLPDARDVIDGDFYEVPNDP
jgi:hypothetical protein